MRLEVINDKGKHLCVLGWMDNDRGNEIGHRMLRWLKAYDYCIHVVHHDGLLYEWPALHYMQELCKNTGEACLYVHTRGAFNHWKTTEPTHIMWEHEFGDLQDVYFQLVNQDKPAVACPFTGPLKHTFYNGFVANAAAMAAIPELQTNEDRMVFEYIFKGSDATMYGTKFNNLDYPTLNAARDYLYRLYK